VSRPRSALGVALISIALVAAACGDDDSGGLFQETTAGNTPSTAGGVCVDAEAVADGMLLFEKIVQQRVEGAIDLIDATDLDPAANAFDGIADDSSDMAARLVALEQETSDAELANQAGLLASVHGELSGHFSDAADAIADDDPDLFSEVNDDALTAATAYADGDGPFELGAWLAANCPAVGTDLIAALDDLGGGSPPVTTGDATGDTFIEIAHENYAVPLLSDAAMIRFVEEGCASFDTGADVETTALDLMDANGLGDADAEYAGFLLGAGVPLFCPQHLDLILEYADAVE